jgi:hypothetical protein
MFDYGRNAARWPFTLDKSELREQARSKGMCTRCLVRRARPGKAYCERCTDFEKRYARKRNQRESVRSMYGYDPYGDKVMRIADYDLASGHESLAPVAGADLGEHATASERESQFRKEVEEELARLRTSKIHPVREPRWYRPGARHTDEGD